MAPNTRLRPLRQMLAASFSAFLFLSALPATATVTTGSMTVPRMMHRSAALPDGRILLTGGYLRPGTAPYASTEIHDPATGLFSAAAAMQTARVEHAAVTLKDGRIMVVGGTIATSPSLVGTNSAEIYDPATGQWSYTGNMIAARARTIARVLPDGKVFVMSKDGYNSPALYAEVWDPLTGVFTKTGNMANQTGWHGMVVLADGRVMKVGGYGSQYMAAAEIWDPATNLWSSTGAMAEARQDISPVLLPNGKVLVAGGSNSMTLSSTEIWDPTTGLFSAGSAMPSATKVHSSSVLPNGDIILLGDYLQYLVRYQSSSNQWNLTGPRRGTPRETNVSVLPGGNLLIAGGADLNDASTYAAVWDIACAPQKITLGGTSLNADGNGGVVNVSITAAPGCRFEATGLPAWLTPVIASPYAMDPAGSMNISFNAAANVTGASRSATISIGNLSATVNQATSSQCPSAPTLSGTSFNFGYTANSGSISVTAAASCAWNFNSLPAWITPTSSTSGSGNGTFTFTVAANSGSQRSASGQFGGNGFARSLTFSQDAVSPCIPVPTLSQTSFNFGSGAQTGSIGITAPAACNWTIALPGWVSGTTSLSGSGNGSISYSVPANKGAQRSGSGQISGPGFASTFNMTQAASPCANWSISPTVLSLANTTSTGSFAVTAPVGCNWNLAAIPSWMSLTGASSGSGNGSISYSVAANTGTARSATANLSGAGPTLSLSLSQAAAATGACSAAINSGVPVNGNLLSNGCATGARGAGYYTDRYTFTAAPGNAVTILLTSSAFDTYVYLRDPAGNVINSNDDGGGGTNSRIPASSGTYTLPAGTGGTYTIEVTSYSSGRTGAYTLNLTK